MLREAADINNLPLFSEIMDLQHLEMMEKYVDVLQIVRNIEFKLLETVGESPLLFFKERHEQLRKLLASEYILARGNENVMLWKEELELLRMPLGIHLI